MPKLTVAMTRGDDTIYAPAGQVETFKVRGYRVAESTTEHLTGAALNAALQAAGLPTTGTADEKRASLADQPATAGPNDDQEVTK